MSPAVYTTVPRVPDTRRHTQAALDAVRWSDQHGFDGVLIFAGAGAVLDPWMLASAAVSMTSRIIPLIAVNPVYVHPVAAARMIASIAHIHGRAVALNLITGTAVSDLETIGDQADHDGRYARLAEYAIILRGLLSSPRPLTYSGTFYTVRRAQLAPAMPAALLPELFIAGQSPAARSVTAQTSATSIRMLPSTLAAPGAPGALHFGVVTRPAAGAAWAAARELFPPDEAGERVVRASMANTDATWKRKLMAVTEGASAGYWTAPFRTGQADCPYVVASHEELAALVASLSAGGTSTFVLDIPPRAEEYRNVAEALRLTCGDSA